MTLPITASPRSPHSQDTSSATQTSSALPYVVPTFQRTDSRARKALFNEHPERTAHYSRPLRIIKKGTIKKVPRPNREARQAIATYRAKLGRRVFGSSQSAQSFLKTLTDEERDAFYLDVTGSYSYPATAALANEKGWHYIQKHLRW